jgi:hypothetical protein
MGAPASRIARECKSSGVIDNDRVCFEGATASKPIL